MSVTDELVPMLKKLRLSGVLHTLALRIRQAVEDGLTFEEFLLRLLSDEVERRDGKQLLLRLRRAQFEGTKTLEDFDFSFNPKIPKARLIDLATAGFVTRRENVCLVGPTGVGKSHLAQALGLRACRAGHSALYLTANTLFCELRAARADRSYDRRLQRLVSPALLIIDDVGLRPLRDEEPEDLYEVIRQRYEHGSTVLTSNHQADSKSHRIVDLSRPTRYCSRSAAGRGGVGAWARRSESRRRRIGRRRCRARRPGTGCRRRPGASSSGCSR
jgi:DNA replication protein DnaC